MTALSETEPYLRPALAGSHTAAAGNLRKGGPVVGGVPHLRLGPARFLCLWC
jgi:hypothetical protein